MEAGGEQGEDYSPSAASGPPSLPAAGPMILPRSFLSTMLPLELTSSSSPSAPAFSPRSDPSFDDSSSSSSSSSFSLCPFPDCGNLVKPAPRPGHETACSPLHHHLVMCRRFCTVRPEFKPSLERFYNIFDAQHLHKCAVDNCSRFPSYKGKWCDQEHYLLWLNTFSNSLHPQQRCKRADCPLHVFVSIENDGADMRIHDFCCWTHCQLYHMSQPQSSVPITNPVENDSCCDLSLEFVIETLKKYVNDKSHRPERVIIDELFFTKHPWDILNKPGLQSCWLIVKCLWRGPQRRLKTKEGYHWKQHGRRHLKSTHGVSRRHLSYLKLNAKKRKAEGCTGDVSFHMVEYTLNEPQFKEYCVVKVTKNCNERPTHQENRHSGLVVEADLRSPSYPFGQFSPNDWTGFLDL